MLESLPELFLSRKILVAISMVKQNWLRPIYSGDSPKREIRWKSYIWGELLYIDLLQSNFELKVLKIANCNFETGGGGVVKRLFNVSVIPMNQSVNQIKLNRTG